MTQPADWPAMSKPPGDPPEVVQVRRRGPEQAADDSTRHTSHEQGSDQSRTQQQNESTQSQSTSPRPENLFEWCNYYFLKFLQWRWAPWLSRWNTLKQSWESISDAEFIRRTWIAWVVAVSVDALQIGLFPVFGTGVALPLNVLLDAVTTIIMTWLLGFHIAFVPTFAMEFMPIVDIAPTWTIAVWIATRRFGSGDGGMMSGPGADKKV